jgi:hypothetical protein
VPATHLHPPSQSSPPASGPLSRITSIRRPAIARAAETTAAKSAPFHRKQQRSRHWPAAQSRHDPRAAAQPTAATEFSSDQSSLRHHPLTNALRTKSIPAATATQCLRMPALPTAAPRHESAPKHQRSHTRCQRIHQLIHWPKNLPIYAAAE